MKRILRALLLTLASLLTLLLAGELGARLAQPLLRSRIPAFYYRNVLSSLTEKSSVLVWEGKHRASTKIPNSESKVIAYRTNGVGWRGREFAPLERPVNALLFGDSFSYGLGVSEEERFSCRLESKHQGLNLWNLAQLGYAPDQHLLLAQRWLPGFDWAFVVVQLSNTDVGDIAGHRWTKFQAGAGIPAEIEPPEAFGWFSSYSEQWNLGAYFLLEKSPLTEAQLEDGLKRLLFSLRELLSLAKERQVPVLLMQATDWGAPAYGEKIASAYEAGVKKLAEEYKLKIYEPGALPLLAFPDLHWTAESHRQAADGLSERILKLPLFRKKKGAAL